MTTQAAIPEPPENPVVLWKLWIVAASLPIAFCAARLNDDLWHDEAYTLVHFASRPVAEIITDYSAPNNHILYTIILRAVYLVSDEEFFLRLPGLVFAAGSLVCAFYAGKWWAGIPGAMGATVWLGLTQMFLIHVMELRGYGLSLLLAGILGLYALPSTWQGTCPFLPHGLVILVATWAIVYTIPTNIFVVLPFVFLATFYELRTGPSALLRGQTRWWVAGLAAGCFCYLPVAGQMRQAAGGTGWDWPASARLAVNFLQAACRDWWPAIGLAVAVLIIHQLVYNRRKSASLVSETGALAPCLSRSPAHFLTWTLAGILGPFLIAAALGVRPFVRHFFPSLFFLATACGVVFAQAMRKLEALAPLRMRWLTRRPAVPAPSRATDKASAKQPQAQRLDYEEWLRGIGASALLVAIVLPRLLTYPERLVERRRQERVQDGYYNFYAARYSPRETVRALYQYVATFAKGRRIQVIYPALEHYPLAYYLAREQPRELAWDVHGEEEIIFLIVPEYQSPAELLKERGITLGEKETVQFLGDFGFYRLYWCPILTGEITEPAPLPSPRPTDVESQAD